MKFLKSLMYAGSFVSMGHLVFTFFRIIQNGYMHAVEPRLWVLYPEMAIVSLLLINVIYQLWEEMNEL